MTHLAIPLVTQPSDSLICGQCCVKMVLDFDGYPQSLETIDQHLPIRDEFGLYIYEIGSYFLSRGYQAEIVCLNTYLFTIKQIGAAQDTIRQHIETVYQDRKDIESWQKILPGIETALDFMAKGGVLTPSIPTANDIIMEMTAGRPVIAAVTSRFMYGDKPGHNEHFAVITGYDGTHVHVNDPAFAHEETGYQTSPIDQVLYAIHANTARSAEGGAILKLRPPR